VSDIERHYGDEEARRDHADSGRARWLINLVERAVSDSNPLTGSILSSQNAPAGSSAGSLAATSSVEGFLRFCRALFWIPPLVDLRKLACGKRES